MISIERILREKFRAALMTIAALAAACGGSGGGGNPPPQIPPPPQSPPPPTILMIDVSLSAADVVGGSAEAGSATATVEYNETDGEIGVVVTLSGLTADSVSVRRGAAGATGDPALDLAAGASASEWSVASTPLPDADISALEAGGLYLAVTTAAEPDGALRGQILPSGVGVARVALEPRQVTAGGGIGAGSAWITIDDNAGLVTIHAATSGIDDADAATVREAAAGNDGPVVETLMQDTADAGHWFLDAVPFSQTLEEAADRGSLYLEFTTPAAPTGALRGQYLPPLLELVITELDDGNVVMSSLPRAARARATVGRTMTTIGPNSITSYVNLFAAADADSVSLRRAPAGQNGPLVVGYQQDANTPTRWGLADVALDAALGAGLDNQTLYVEVTTPAAPNGFARGQIVTEGSLVPDDSAFLITAVTPANAAQLDAFPTSIVATANRAPLPESVSPASVAVEASGMDGSFGDGNETTLTPTAVSASGSDVTINMTGVVVSDDVYRVSFFGSGPNAIVDTLGIPLDGDGDGNPGGTYETAFEYAAPPPPAATFTEIQNTIFTPSCATVGCHSGSNPPDGLNLSAGVAYADIVNVAAVQMPSLLLIEPGDPDDSYLVRKIQGTGIVANRMPLNASPLTQQQIDLVRQWVSDGAPNN